MEPYKAPSLTRIAALTPPLHFGLRTCLHVAASGKGRP